MPQTNSLLHGLIREQNRAMYDLVQNIREDIPEENMSKHFKMALEDAEALCQPPAKEEDDAESLQ